MSEGKIKNEWTDAEYEELTRAYWGAREPGCDEVAVSVRKGGRVVRFVLLTADAAVTLGGDSAEAGPAV